MRKIIQNTKKRFSLNEASKKRQDIKKYSGAILIFGGLLFLIDYLFKLEYIEIIGTLCIIAGFIQYGREVGREEGFSEGFSEGYDKGGE